MPLTRSRDSEFVSASTSEQTSRSETGFEEIFESVDSPDEANRYMHPLKFHLPDRFSCIVSRAQTPIGSDLNIGLPLLPLFPLRFSLLEFRVSPWWNPIYYRARIIVDVPLRSDNRGGFADDDDDDANDGAALTPRAYRWLLEPATREPTPTLIYLRARLHSPTLTEGTALATGSRVATASRFLQSLLCSSGLRRRFCKSA